MITIYKASAGSGKTYRLTYVYLTQILGDRGDDGEMRLCCGSRRHRDILAITFTNKATDEMKRRIVHELAVLAGMEPGWTKKSKYLGDLTRDLHCSAADLAAAARSALYDLLFGYNDFNVSTIDSFFQTVIRSFAREAEVAGNYNVELDQKETVTQSLGMMLDDISREEVTGSGMTQRMAWIIQMMKARLSESKAFNVFDRSNSVFGNMTQLISQLLSETFTLNAEEMISYLEDGVTGSAGTQGSRKPGDSRISRFAKAVQKRLVQDQQTLQQAAAAIVKAVEDEGAERWTNTTYFKKIRECSAGWPKDLGVTPAKAIDDPLIYIKKDFKNEISPELCSIISDGCRRIVRCFNEYAMLKCLTADLYEAGLLGETLTYIKQYCQENNLLLISDTADLLRRIIGDDRAVAPFLYERIGQRLNHFLIDEFQDTSRLQWHNLRPLIDESVANAHDNLIIGDEKQCIYRFRNSEPELLQSQVEIDFPAPASVVTGNTVDANTNWRSSADVVRFNNTFFTAMARALGAEQIYAGVAQQVAPKNLNRRGYVSITNLDHLGDKDEIEKRSLEIMAENILRQLNSGYSPGHIVALARSKKDAAKIIDHLYRLMEDEGGGFPRFNIVSDDSLYIERSPAVRLILSALRWLAAPSVEEGDTRASSARRTAYFINRYQHYRSNAGQGLSPEEAVERAAADLVEPPSPAEAESLRALSLNSLVERIISQSLTPEELAEECVFITAFQDVVADYVSRGDGDLATFLEWWDAHGHESTVSSSQDMSSMRVMTVHKAKGLEFPCVHVPFASWGVKYDELKWCEVPELGWIDDPSIRPPMLPVKMTKKLENIPEYADVYKMHTHEVDVDELNVLYVAFTRAVDELCVCYTTVKKSGNETTFGSNILETMESITADMVNSSWRELSKRLSDGAPSVLIDPPAQASASMVIGEPTTFVAEESDPPTLLDPVDGGAMPEYSASLRPDVWSGITFEDEEDFSRARDRGTIMHSVMESVTTPSDIRPAVERLAARDRIPRELVDEIAAHLESQVTRPETAMWYDGFERVLIERPIVLDGTTERPDRVVWTADGHVDVIDYKFGAENNREYSKQVRRYMRLLQAAGVDPASLRGFIWYLDTGKLVEVEL